MELKRSAKAIGKYEAPLINRICSYFASDGFRVFPHIRLNVAWSASLSDVDALLIKNETIVAIEVKSSQDKFSRAHYQLKAIADYVDYAYVATDRLPRNLFEGSIGLLQIAGDTVKIIKLAEPLEGKPTVQSLMALPRKCLLNVLDIYGQKGLLKYELAHMMRDSFDDGFLRLCAKEVAFCQECTLTRCPAMLLRKNYAICSN